MFSDPSNNDLRDLFIKILKIDGEQGLIKLVPIFQRHGVEFNEIQRIMRKKEESKKRNLTKQVEFINRIIPQGSEQDDEVDYGGFNKPITQYIPEEEIASDSNYYEFNSAETYEFEKNINKLIEEICLDGSSTIASIIRRGKGVSYSEIVYDVAEKIKVEEKEIKHYDNEKAIESKAIEKNILIKIFQNYLDFIQKNNKTDYQKLYHDIEKISGVDDKKKIIKEGILSFALLIDTVGPKIGAKVIERIIINIIGKGIAKETAKVVMRATGWAIPLLNIALIVWTIIDLQGPAYRKTIPTVLEIALLRLEYDAKI